MHAPSLAVAQVPTDVLARRMTPISSLVLPPKQRLHGPESTMSSPPPFFSQVGSGSNDSIDVVADNHHHHHHQPPPPMTAKKSGYSSYWSVHERSAFMHYAVRLGQDWQALADAIGSKTGTQVRNYFRANRERLQLDAVMNEYERNRVAGTLPPMIPFQPAPSLLQPASPVTSAAAAATSATTPGDDLGLRKEKRGRKRKNDMSRSSAEPAAAAQAEVGGHGAKRPPPHPAVAPPPPLAHPSTAPASMANFPTMGVDGGRAVVFARPAPPQPVAPLLTRPPQNWAAGSVPPRPTMTA
ncbi:DNA-binding protein snt1, partial [Coemansia aciculifera]